MKFRAFDVVVCIAWFSQLSLCQGTNNVQPNDINGTHFDYVIVGGGTAGLVVASRLSEDPKITVAVIEAGDFERNNPNVTNTTVLGIAAKTSVDWQYESVPQVYATNNSLIWSAGKGLGGSSLINGRWFDSSSVQVIIEYLRNDLYATCKFSD